VGIECEPEPWPLSVSQFPLVGIIPGLIFVFLIIINDGRDYLGALREHNGLRAAWTHASRAAVWNRAMVFFGYLIAMILMTLVIGQKLALPLFVAVYLIRWGRYNWRTAFGYAAGGWLVLILFYDRIMDLFWHPSWLNSWLPQLLPDWLLAWLFF
jgi:putative tricarboxylic transport membrane protein